MLHEPGQLRATIERYLLGEMTPEEETQWEVHYLECNQCLRALERAQTLSQFLKQESRFDLGLVSESENAPGSNRGLS